jgi:hypothetical protein
MPIHSAPDALIDPELMAMNRAISYSDESIALGARTILSLMLLAVACLFVDVVAGIRGLDVGTDTYTYATYFLSSRNEIAATRLEPGFILVTRVLSATGMSVTGYQMFMFAILLMTAIVAARRYFDYLGNERGYLTFLTAALMFLFLSPMFVNASINAVRQGLAALLVFAALLAFHRHQWRYFILYGVLASSFHYSSLLYLALAPMLLFSVRVLRIVAVLAFVAYCSGMTMVVVRAVAPFIYNAVMDYSMSATYRAGVRIDFAVFSIFWYVLPLMMSRLVHKPFSTRIKDSTVVYMVMLLPFFLLGWGNFSNRYLLPAYLATSLIVAAIFFNNRISPLRNPILLRGGLVVSCAVFCYYVNHQVIV